MPVVKHQLRVVGGGAASGSVTISHHPHSFTTDHGDVVLPLTVAVPASGLVEADLPPEADYVSAGYYVITEPGGHSHTFQVPDEAGPLWLDDLVTPVAPTSSVLPVLFSALRDTGALAAATDGQVPVWHAATQRWVPGTPSGGVTDHGQLDGLSDHDHPQYYTEAETDTLLAAKLATALVDAKGDLLAGSAADTVTRLAVGSDGQVLTADSGEATGLRWATPASGVGVDLVAATYGCLALTFGPVGVGGNATQEIRIAEDRSIVCRLALPAGTLVSGIRLPVAGLTTANGDLFGTVYHADGTVLGTTADVSGALSTGDAQVWRDIPLPAPVELVGDHLYVALTNTVPAAESLQIVICQFDGAGAIPLWLFDGAAFRLDGLATPADPLVPAAGTAYWAPCIGVY